MVTEAMDASYITEARQHLEQAYAFEESQKLENALHECESALELDPNYAEVHNLRGLILEGLGRTKEAVAAYREAVYLDPNFDDAQLNLAEVQQEIHKSRLAFLQEAVRDALRGAFGYGASFAIAGGLIVLFKGGVVINAILYTLASGLGAAVLWKTGNPRSSVGRFAGAGALGFALAYLATIIPYRLVTYFLPRSDFLMIALTIQSVMIGASHGVLLGADQKDWSQVRWLALAGAIGFGFYGWVAQLVRDIFLPLMEPTQMAALVLYSTQWAILGGISGALLGLGLVKRNAWDQKTTEAKGVYVCSDCGTHVAEAAKTCPRCGADISELADAEAGDVGYECPECGADVTQEAQTCPRCGAEFEPLDAD